MISFFRNFFQSKLGVGITLAFLGLIAIAFAASDVTNTGMFGGVAGGDRVANVGERTISTADLNQNVTNQFQRAREQDPTLSMEGFIAGGGFDEILDAIISRSAIAEFAENLGLRAGSRLVDSEIVNGGGFMGLDGQFDDEAFRASLRQRGLTEATVRDDIGMSLLAQQMVVPISYQARMPTGFARTYAQLLNETRRGTAAVFPAEAFAPEGGPSDAQLQAYYTENRARYIRPERRRIRYASFGPDELPNIPPVTNAQVAARYRQDAPTLYQAREERTFTQVVTQTQSAAQELVQAVNGGASLEQAAQRAGLATTTVSEVEQADFASTASQAVARAAFAGDTGEIATPTRGSLGWYVLRVDSVSEIGARSLADASDDIRATLLAERQQQALDDFSETLETEFRRGKTLLQAAQELDAELDTTPELLASGQVYGQAAQPPQELARVVQFAFELDENEPQIIELVPGQAFMIFEVAAIQQSAAPPLAEIREQVEAAWVREQGMAAAGQAAQRVLQRVESGMSFADAVRREEADLPAPRELNLNRRALANAQQITRATILFFSMAEGTVKRVAVPDAARWFVVELDEIDTPELAADAQEVQNTVQSLSQVMGEEYVAQFVTAAENSLTIERNEAGIEAVRGQLTGATRN